MRSTMKNAATKKATKFLRPIRRIRAIHFDAVKKQKTTGKNPKKKAPTMKHTKMAEEKHEKREEPAKQPAKQPAVAPESPRRDQPREPREPGDRPPLWPEGPEPPKSPAQPR